MKMALLSRDVIGQTKGILMERLKLTPEDAFEALRLASQRLNIKLHAVASGLAETGEVDVSHIRSVRAKQHAIPTDRDGQ